MTMFERFTRRNIGVGETEISLVQGGDGPPVLLLHGFPETRAAWHKVAPSLAEGFTVVVPDLPGYGDSVGPEPDPDHMAYSKRTMATRLVECMGALGYRRFAVAGHDRGGRIAYRMALDHPERVRRLAVLAIVPTLDMAEMMADIERGLATYHWYFLAQPAPLPERLIAADPDFYLAHTIRSWSGRHDAIEPAAMEEYRRCFRRESVIRAACADYRAGLTVDLANDRADREAGRRISCPVLVIWADGGVAARRPVDYVAIWRRWADDVRGRTLEVGHFVMEEAPAETIEELQRFFAEA